MNNAEDLNFYLLARDWARRGEYDAGLIVLEALLKKYPNDFRLVLTVAEIQEKKNPLQALSYYSQILAGEEPWLEFLQILTDVERGILYERHGLLSLTLKDEASALESLRRAASVGHDSLAMWGLLALLFVHQKEFALGLKALLRSLELYHEPTLFCSLQNNEKIMVNEGLFSNISLTLLPQLSARDARKGLLAVKRVFGFSPWMSELQEIVAKAIKDMPIDKSGDNYARTDSENW